MNMKTIITSPTRCFYDVSSPTRCFYDVSFPLSLSTGGGSY